MPGPRTTRLRRRRTCARWRSGTRSRQRSRQRCGSASAAVLLHESLHCGAADAHIGVRRAGGAAGGAAAHGAGAADAGAGAAVRRRLAAQHQRVARAVRLAGGAADPDGAGMRDDCAQAGRDARALRPGRLRGAHGAAGHAAELHARHARHLVRIARAASDRLQRDGTMRNHAGRRTPGRAKYWTPGFWTAAVEPQWTPGTPAAFTPGKKGAHCSGVACSITSHQRLRAGTVIPGACTPASYTKATVVPGWIEKKDCKV